MTDQPTAPVLPDYTGASLVGLVPDGGDVVTERVERPVQEDGEWTELASQEIRERETPLKVFLAGGT